MAELEIKPTTGQRLRSVIVIAAAVALTATLIVLIVGGGGDLLARRTTITTYMPDGTGLAGYSIVRVNGIPIGKVSQVGISGLLDPQRAIKVEMRVVTRFLKNIPIDSQTNIGKDTLVGYPFIDIDLGKSRTTLPENGVLQSEPLQQAVVRADQVRALEGTFQQINDLLAEVSSPTSQIGSVINSATEYNNVTREIAEFDGAVRTLITPKSSIGQAFYDSDIYEGIHRRVLAADRALEAIQSGNGVVGHLLARDDEYVNAERALTGLHQTLADINAGKGGFGKLVVDDEGYQKIAKLLASTDAALQSLNAGEGRAGDLQTSPKLYESLNGQLREIQSALKDLRGNPKKYLRYKLF